MIPSAMATVNIYLLMSSFIISQKITHLQNCTAVSEVKIEPSPRPISTGRLNALPRLHLRPIDLVVYEGSYPVDPVGELILGSASRLDAFSGYPVRTWLTSSAPGGTTGTPEVRSPRSSRTRGNSPQFSCARSG